MTDGQSVAGGRYVLDAPLGRGGMAQVHRGTDIRLGRPVAVKLLSAHLAADPAAQARFRREAKAAASLNHPNIASVFDTGEDSDPTTGIAIPFIVMELVEGPTLRQLLDDDGPLPPHARSRDHPERARRARPQPRCRDHPPRHQAGQCDAHPDRPGQGDGLRHRSGDRRHLEPDPDRGRHRHRAVPLPRAGVRQAPRPAQRSLLGRVPALRAARRAPALCRRDLGQRGLPARTRSTAGAEPAQPGGQSGAGRCGVEGPGQESR